jgi:hypothetical protein
LKNVGKVLCKTKFKWENKAKKCAKFAGGRGSDIISRITLISNDP